MEVILVVGFALVSVFGLENHESLDQDTAIRRAFLVCAYFGFTYSLAVSTAQCLTSGQKGADMVSETIEDARDITNEKMLNL